MLLDGDQPALLEPGGLGPGERLVGEVGQRRPPPQRQGLAENTRACAAWPAASASRPDSDQRLEAGGVELVGRHSST